MVSVLDLIPIDTSTLTDYPAGPGANSTDGILAYQVAAPKGFHRVLWQSLLGEGLALVNGQFVVRPTTAAALTATGSTITDALPLPAHYSVFSSVPPGTGTRTVISNLEITVLHADFAGGNQLLIYPPDSSWSINGLAGGSPIARTAPLAANRTTVLKLKFFPAFNLIEAY